MAGHSHGAGPPSLNTYSPLVTGYHEEARATSTDRQHRVLIFRIASGHLLLVCSTGNTSVYEHIRIRIQVYTHTQFVNTPTHRQGHTLAHTQGLTPHLSGIQLSSALIYPEHSREQGSKQKRHLSSQVRCLKSPCTKAHAPNASEKPEGPNSELTYFNFTHNSNTLGQRRRPTGCCSAGNGRNCGLVPARTTDNGFVMRDGEIMEQVDTHTLGSLGEGTSVSPEHTPTSRALYAIDVATFCSFDCLNEAWGRGLSNGLKIKIELMSEN